MNYAARWGNGEWQQFQVAPNGWRSHYFDVTAKPNQGTPGMSMKFDYDFADGYQERFYAVKKFRFDSNDCNRMHQRSQFQFTQANRLIDLFQVE